MSVYFVREGRDGSVKIGTAEDVFERLASLQCGNHRRLRLMRVVIGGLREERWFHRQFKRVRGEWFEYDIRMRTLEPPPDLADDVADRIASLRRQGATWTEATRAVGLKSIGAAQRRLRFHYPSTRENAEIWCHRISERLPNGRFSLKPHTGDARPCDIEAPASDAAA